MNLPQLDSDLSTLSVIKTATIEHREQVGKYVNATIKTDRDTRVAIRLNVADTYDPKTGYAWQLSDLKFVVDNSSLTNEMYLMLDHFFQKEIDSALKQYARNEQTIQELYKARKQGFAFHTVNKAAESSRMSTTLTEGNNLDLTLLYPPSATLQLGKIKNLDTSSRPLPG